MSSAQVIAATVAAVLTSCSVLLGGIRWIVRSYLHELVPNSGKSIKDQINRLDHRIDEIYNILLEKK